MIELVKRLLFGPTPYLGCLNNKDLDAEIKWAKARESA